MTTTKTTTAVTTTSNNNNDQQRPSVVTIWWTAARPHTLTASICPCLVSYMANRDHPLYDTTDMILWTLFCITIQLGTNLHNDYADYIRGADDKKTRIGQTRATAAGWITPFQTCCAATFCLSITFICGVALLYRTQQLSTNVVAWFLILSSIFNAFAYTSGPYPLGYIGLQNYSIAYSGLGDIFVFLYFGLVATYMIPYLLYCQQQKQELPLNYHSQIIYGIQIGLLAMNILVVNNLRDRLTDVIATKLTTSVRFGRYFSLYQYTTCYIISYLLVIINIIIYYNSKDNKYQSIVSILKLGLPLVSIPIAIKETKAVWKKDGASLNIHVGGAAKVQTIFCLLTAISLYLVQ